MKIQPLEDWSCIAQCATLYSEPKLILRGRRVDGVMIRTSPILNINGPLITTATGSVYQLGIPNPDYVEWCKSNGHHVPTPEEPIKNVNSFS